MTSKCNQSSRTPSKNQEYAEIYKMFDQAFEKVVHYINEKIICNREIIPLKNLVEVFQKHLKENFPNLYNDKYNHQKLADRIISHYEKDSLISSVVSRDVPGTSGIRLFYSAKMTMGEAVSRLYKEQITDTKLKKLAVEIRNEMKTHFTKLGEFTFPPAIEELKDTSLPNTSLLLRFLCLVITGKDINKYVGPRFPKLKSICDTIIYVTTCGRYKTITQASISALIRQYSGNATIQNCLNKLGFTESIWEVLRTEAAVACQLTETGSFLPQNIIRDNSDLTVVWALDNFDDRAHHYTTHVCMQNQPLDLINGEKITLPAINKKTPQKFKPFTAEGVSLFYDKNVKPPNIDLCPSSDPCKIPTCSFEDDLDYFCWMIARTLLGEDSQNPIPRYKAWVSLYGNLPQDCRTEIAYLPPLLQPITDPNVIYYLLKEYLRISQQELSQNYILVVADLGVCMPAWRILWLKNSEFRSKVMILPGNMHWEMAFYAAMGKWLEGSGFDDILIRSRIASPGCVSSILKGKNIFGARKSYDVFSTVLQFLLIDTFKKFTEESTIDECNEMKNLLAECKNIFKNYAIDTSKKGKRAKEGPWTKASNTESLTTNTDIKKLKNLFEKFKEIAVDKNILVKPVPFGYCS